MPDQPTTGLPETTAARRPETLTAEKIESVLDDFRAWLHEAAEKGAIVHSPAPAPDAIDLHTLLGQFLALRHEVNLQTKAVRAQQEQNTQTLALLEQALQSSRQSRPGNGDEPARAHLKCLIETHDALALAAREGQRVRESVLPSLDRLAAAEPPAARSQPSFFARLFGDSDATALRQSLAQERGWREDAQAAAGRARGMLDSLITGYTMSLQRLERALRQNELEPIPCVGEPFDPERMEALEVVTETDRPSGEVLGEIRRGYLWRGRVFRHAQVRVAKWKSGVGSRE